MKTTVGLLVFSLLLGSCMSYHCHTYDGSKRHSGVMVSSKKTKPVKNRTPYYKVTKQAEKD